MTQITFYLFATKLGIKIKNNIEGHGQRSPKLIEMLSMLRYIFGPNLELPTSIVGEWLHRKAQKRVNFDFQVKFELEGQGQSTPKTIGILTKMFCMSGSNLVILVRTSDKLSHGQARDWRPHGQTQATTIPEGQNWPRVKIEIEGSIPIKNYFIFFFQIWTLAWEHDDDDVTKWKHFPRYWPFVRGIQRSPVNSPHKGQWHGALMLSLICVWINGWVNNREAGDLRRHRAHYDVIVMGKNKIKVISNALVFTPSYWTKYCLYHQLVSIRNHWLLTIICARHFCVAKYSHGRYIDQETTVYLRKILMEQLYFAIFWQSRSVEIVNSKQKNKQ